MLIEFLLADGLASGVPVDGMRLAQLARH